MANDNPKSKGELRLNFGERFGLRRGLPGQGQGTGRYAKRGWAYECVAGDYERFSTPLTSALILLLQ